MVIISTMKWNELQLKRIKHELEVIQQYFPGFKQKYLDTELCVEGWMKTNLGRKYNLRLYVPRDIPNSIPQIVIIFPLDLRDYHGKKLVDYGQNVSMHLLSPKDGYPSICTYKPTYWHPNLTFYNVLIKTRIWLEAYQGHLITKRPLDYFLKHQL